MVECSSQRTARVKLRRPITLYEWKGPFEGWARNWVHKNFWRVKEYCGSEEDAMAECAWLFSYCLKLYAKKVDNPAHLMALFKRTVTTHWATISIKDSQIRECHVPVDEERVDHNLGMLATAISEASIEAQTVIKALANAPAEFLAILLGNQDSELSEQGQVLLNRRIKRLLRIARSDKDIVAELRTLLS
jgi:hypothetical protein